jgi:DNA-directed RNA polymerase sigma subunit (sigma70/sigma32)
MKPAGYAARTDPEQYQPTLSREICMHLLAQRMAQLPPVSAKIIAMHYHENMQIAELAVCFDLSEERIRQIVSQTLALLRAYASRLFQNP